MNYILAWNVNGYDDKIHKYVIQLLKEEQPDILFLSETKKNKDYLTNQFKTIEGYNVIINPHIPSCYHGVAMLIKNTLIYEEIIIDLNIVSRSDSKGKAEQGRIIAIKVNDINIIASYTPNSGGYKDEKKLNYRTKVWDPAFQKMLNNLGNNTVWIGDINVAPNTIDVSNPYTMSKWAGFTTEERDNIHLLLGDKWVDIWRHLYPTKKAYTWVSYPHKTNYGLRLDNIIISKDLLSTIEDATILSTCTLSDHIPIGLKFIHK
jgi:exodeoxyribonuclease-3